MTHVLASRSFHHSGVIPKAALLSEGASLLATPILSAIPEFLHSGDFSSAQNNYDNKSYLISALNYTMTTYHH